MDIVTDELNVKAFEFVQDPRRLVSYRILPDNKLLGPRFGARFPALRQALANADPYQVAVSVSAGLPVSLLVDGETVELAPDEILVNTQPAEGLAVAADKLITVAIDAAITPELRAEGLVRDLVRRRRDEVRHRVPLPDRVRRHAHHGHGRERQRRGGLYDSRCADGEKRVT